MYILDRQLLIRFVFTLSCFRLHGESKSPIPNLLVPSNLLCRETQSCCCCASASRSYLASVDRTTLSADACRTLVKLIAPKASSLTGRPLASRLKTDGVIRPAHDRFLGRTRGRTTASDSLFSNFPLTRRSSRAAAFAHLAHLAPPCDDKRSRDRSCYYHYNCLQSAQRDRYASRNIVLSLQKAGPFLFARVEFQFSFFYPSLYLNLPLRRYKCIIDNICAKDFVHFVNV